jgi:hypothetical protein
LGAGLQSLRTDSRAKRFTEASPCRKLRSASLAFWISQSATPVRIFGKGDHCVERKYDHRGSIHDRIPAWRGLCPVAFR